MSDQGAYLPYGRQYVDKDDIDAVGECLASDWLTTGPQVAAFEEEMAGFCGNRFAVAVSSGTAALHCAMHALRIGPGDEVLVPAMTFAATANSVLYQGGVPVFVDVEPDTLCIDVADVCRKITGRTRAIIAVDYAGQPCSYDELQAVARQRGLFLVADACHSLGAGYEGASVGSLADLTVFSFHPVKHITTGEGGMVVTNSAEWVKEIRRFRNHGIDSDHRQREASGTWEYAMTELGFNYRITDFQCALGRSQLRKLSGFVARRQNIARHYDHAFAAISAIRPLAIRPGVSHAFHLYVVRFLNSEVRQGVFRQMRTKGIGVNVHYLPVYLHPYYRSRFDYGPGLCPVAEAAYERILSLPVWPGMTDDQVERVVSELQEMV